CLRGLPHLFQRQSIEPVGLLDRALLRSDGVELLRRGLDEALLKEYLGQSVASDAKLGLLCNGLAELLFSANEVFLAVVRPPEIALANCVFGEDGIPLRPLLETDRSLEVALEDRDDRGSVEGLGIVGAELEREVEIALCIPHPL